MKKKIKPLLCKMKKTILIGLLVITILLNACNNENYDNSYDNCLMECDMMYEIDMENLRENSTLECCYTAFRDRCYEECK